MTTPNPRSVVDGVVGRALRRLEDYVRQLSQRVDEVSNAVPSITYGTTAGTACEGNDSRLSDSRAPTAHAASHLPGGSDALTTAAAGAIEPDDAAAVGTAASFARSDHKHSIVAAAPGTIQPDDSAAEGSATSFARSDHRHAIVAAAPGIVTPGASAAEGSSTSFARADHVHSMNAISGITSGSERWVHPASAHADDEEYETSTDPFTLYDSSGVAVASEPTDTTIDPYSNDTTHHHSNVNSFRPGWLTFKCRNNNSRFYYVKSHTSPTNQCTYTRVGMKSRPSPANNEDDIGLMLMAATSGHPDPNNRIELIWQQTTAGRKCVARITSAGVDNTVFNGATFGTEWELYSYLIIGKVGTTFHFWLAGDSGGWSYLGNGTFSGTIAYVGYLFQTNSSTPGNGLNQTDFLRFVDSATFIP